MKSEQGSMALVFFLILATGALSILILSILTWQVGQVKNEQTLRDTQISLDSTMNLAAESVGSSGRGLIGVNMISEPAWEDSPLDGIVNRWWAVPVNGRDTAKVPTPETFAYMTSNNNLTVAISFTNLIYASTDGASWINTGKSPLPYTEISDFDYGNSSFLITARPNSKIANSLFYYSNDGKNWAAAPIFNPSPLGSEKISRIACSPDKCIIITSNPGVSSRYWVSTNLSEWTLSLNSNTNSAVHLATEIAYGGNRFLTVSYDGVESASSFSTDGTTWSEMTSFASSGLAITDLEYVGTNFVGVAAGTNDILFYESRVDNFGEIDTSQVVLTSPDGLSWENTPLPISQHWSNLISDGTRAVLLAESDSLTVLGGTSTFLATTNGIDWTSRTLPVSGSYGNGAILRNSTVITSPYTTEGFVAADDASRAALPLEIYVRGQVKSNAFAGSRVLEGVYKFSWDILSSRWELTDAFNELDFSLSAKYNLTPKSTTAALVGGQAQIAFTDVSDGSPSSWYWDFGDGTSSTEQNPTKNYTTAGTYTVRLTTYEPGGYSSTYSLDVRIQALASAPREVTIKSDGRALTTAWKAPANDGASPIAYYKVRYKKIGTIEWSEVSVDPNILTRRLSNLLSRDSYDVQVAAVTLIGRGAWSNTSNQAPLSTPTEPSSLSLTGLLDMLVDWTASADNGGSPIIGYRIQTATDPDFTSNVTVRDLIDSPTKITHLNEYSDYYARLFAVNAVGLSDPSNIVQVSTIGRASMPRFFDATSVENVISLSWREPVSTGGTPVTSYEISYTQILGDFDSGTTITRPSNSLDFDIPTLAGETYFVRMRAVTSASTGHYTDTIEVTANTVPSDLEGLEARGVAGSIRISWDSAASNAAGVQVISAASAVNLTPGIYKSSAALSLTGTATLDAQGDPDAVFLIQVEGAFNLAANAKINLVNGGSPANVFWVVDGAVNIGAGAKYLGTAITSAAVTAASGSTVEGKLLSTNGAVTLNANVIESYDTTRGWTDASVVNLGLASTYAIFSGGVLSNTGATTIVGDIGSIPATFAGSSTVSHTGEVNLSNQVAADVKADLAQAFAKARTATSTSPVTSYVVSWFSANNTENSIMLNGKASSLLVREEDTTGDGIANEVIRAGRTYIFTIVVTNAVGSRAFTVSGIPSDLEGLESRGDSRSIFISWDTSASSSAGIKPIDGDMISKTLTPGIYRSSGALSLTGTVTLDAQGDPNAVFLIQVTGALNLAATGKMKLVNGGSPANIFWISDGAVNIGAGAEYLGTAITYAAITAGSNAKINGKLLSIDGAVTLTANIIESYDTTRGFSDASAIDLGLASTYAIFSGGALSNSGATTIVGDIGSVPASFAGYGTVNHTGKVNLSNQETADTRIDLIEAFTNARNADSTSPVSSYVISWLSANNTENSITLPGEAASITVSEEDTTGDGIANERLVAGRTYRFTIVVTKAAGSRTFTISEVPRS
jgi:PKD repeat protein